MAIQNNSYFTIRTSSEERELQRQQTATEALTIAETNVNTAINFIRGVWPSEFRDNRGNYLQAFNTVYDRAQERMLTNECHLVKNYVWPDSFPDCTLALHTIVNRWIRHHFRRQSRAKCLILIGPPGTGKTTFAKSLPGPFNYFNGQWRLNDWNESAYYSIYDNIPWDEFEEKGYPAKTKLLIQNGPFNATDQTRQEKTIQVTQPAIVLFNSIESAGSLAREPTDAEEQQTANYWRQRATIYKMGPNEYFYNDNETIHG